MIHYEIECPVCGHKEELDEDMSYNAEFLSDDEVEQYRRGYCMKCHACIEYTVRFNLDDFEGDVIDAYAYD